MSKRPGSEFERSALASRLLTQDQIRQGKAALRPPPDQLPTVDGSDTDAAMESPTDEALANKLVELGSLNLWQAMQLLAGRTKFTLGPYRIVDSVGRGGMGQVFKGVHHVLDRTVAIKVLPLEKSTPEAVQNFTREIQAQAQLDHKNLVRAIDAGEDGNVYYLVTEYVPGSDLRKLVRRSGPLGMQAAASIVSQVAAGLEHAHQQGLVHRDVKPGNVLVTPDGHAKLSDLGLAGPLRGDVAADPRFGRIVGTADYLSPDHILAPWDPKPAWDIYSLGCTLYYAVTGKVPFPKGSTRDKARAHCELRPLDPRRLNPNLDAAFVDVLAAMMAKDPAERMQTAAEVIERLSPWAGSPSPIPPVRNRPPRTTKPPGPDEAFSSAKAEVEDTKPSFPEFAELADFPTASTPGGADGSSAVEITVAGPQPPVSILRPLAILVLFPVAVVGLVMLVWWLVGLLG